MPRTILVTGSSGLIGSTTARHFHELGWAVHGLDVDARAAFLGPGAARTRLTSRSRFTTLVP